MEWGRKTENNLYYQNQQLVNGRNDTTRRVNGYQEQKAKIIF